MSTQCRENLKSRVTQTLILTSLILISACGGAGTSSVAALGGGFSQGEVRPLEFGSSGQADVVFSELSGSEEFAFILFAANVNEGSFNFQLKSSVNGATSKLLETPSHLYHEEADADPTASFHRMLREEESLLGDFHSDNYGTKSISTGEDGGVIENPTLTPCADGAGIVIKVMTSLNDTNQYQSTCGIEKRRTSNAVYYLDESVLHSISDSNLNPIIDDFEAKIAAERDLLGSESDVDRNGLFAVYFTPGVNRLGTSSGGYITGYFFGGDLFSREGIPSSNEMEILYMSIPDPAGLWGVNVQTGFWMSNIAPTVLTHEYQHMINFNQKVMINGIGAEHSWANEGISHLLEDLDTQGTLDQVSEENPSRVGLYLNGPENAPFTDGTSLAQRGGAYLFFRYLCEQANLNRYPGVSSCSEFLRGLLQSDQKGVLNIEEVTGWPLRNILLDFYATLQLSDTGITSDPRYNFSGICLTCSQDDNRGTLLQGVSNRELPHVSTNGSVRSPGGLFYNVQGDALINAGQAVSFEAGAGMIPGGAVIRLQ